MQLEVGSVLEGKVTGITKFGAFVELAPGKTGMVHISEVASTYVKEISDHLALNDMVQVKVIGITPEGKISLSIKQAAPAGQFEQPRTPFRRDAENAGHQGAPDGQRRPPRPSGPRKPFREVSYGFDRRQSISSDTMSFEDMMSKFKQTSDDKMSDLKKYTDMKRGTARSRNPQR